MTREDAAQAWQPDHLVIVLAEIEEGVAIVAMDADVAAEANLEAAAGVPAEFRGAQRLPRTVKRFNAALVPARTAEQVWLKRSGGKLQQQRCLNRPLTDLLIEKLEILAAAVERHLDADATGRHADLTADEPH